MWALRRASDPLRSPGFSVVTARACCSKVQQSSNCVEQKVVISQSPPAVVPDRGWSLVRHYHRAHDFSAGRCGFASQAGAKSGGEEDDDVEDGFSELESPASAEDKKEDGLLSESDLSGSESEVEDEMELAENETESKSRKAHSELFKVIVGCANRMSIDSELDKWIGDGKELKREEISLCMLLLRKRRMYGRALQLSEWVEARKQLEFEERDYASRLDLISKTRGLAKAENYVEMVPVSFRGELLYRTLLATCVSAAHVKKAEAVFNKMRDLEFPVSAFACNQLLLLYKRIDKKKIADVLLLMEKENVKPSGFTYRLLIDTKGLSNDISGMDQIVETMKAEGIEPDIRTQAVMVRHYISGGLKEKAEALLKEMEGGNLERQRWAYRILLPLYAELGQSNEVIRIWKYCESKPSMQECAAAIEAWGKLNNVEEAEAIFDRMRDTWKKLNAKHYTALLRVYANHKMLEKGKNLVQQMDDNGCRIGPIAWDFLVRLHVEAGDPEKAYSILQKAAQKNQLKPMFTSYMVIMDEYVKRGDVHNAEKLFVRMKQAGYTARIRQFLALVQTYINAKVPAYGMRDRMRADNIFPNGLMAAKLTQVDAFRKSAVSDLLD